MHERETERERERVIYMRERVIYMRERQRESVRE